MKTVLFVSNDSKNKIIVEFDPKSQKAEVRSTLRITVYSDGRDTAYIAATSTLEQFIMNAACAGVDIETPSFNSAVRTTWDNIDRDYKV